MTGSKLFACTQIKTNVILSAAKNLGFNVMKQYYVYIMSSKTRRLYTGVTNDLARRIYEHKNATNDSFASKYNINRLVYIEESPSIKDAISREKQIKGWLRSRKVALVESANPQWSDLARDWFETRDSSLRSE